MYSAAHVIEAFFAGGFICLVLEYMYFKRKIDKMIKDWYSKK